MVSKRRKNAQYSKISALSWEAYLRMREHFSTLSDAQLSDANEAVENLNSTNCGWYVYRAKELLQSAIADVRQIRSATKERA